MPIKPERIREARGEMTQEMLAEKLAKQTRRRTRAQHVSSWERGRCEPGSDYLDALVAVTGRSVGFFFGEKVNEKFIHRKAAQGRRRGAVRRTSKAKEDAV